MFCLCRIAVHAGLTSSSLPRLTSAGLRTARLRRSGTDTAPPKLPDKQTALVRLRKQVMPENSHHPFIYIFKDPLDLLLAKSFCTSPL